MCPVEYRVYHVAIVFAHTCTNHLPKHAHTRASSDACVGGMGCASLLAKQSMFLIGGSLAVAAT
eukprot:COSAG01_NODE_17455_length_1150_cov_1.427212_2_plen_63_part_01